MCDWQKNLEHLLTASKECRAWFVCNVMFQPKLIVSFLLCATSLDVRFFFANTLCVLLNLTRNDPIESLQPFLVDCADFKLETVYLPGDTVSDVLLSLLLIVPRNNFAEFTSHPAQYFSLFHQYANLGMEQKKQMVRKGVLHSMLVLVSQEGYRIKVVYHDTAKLYGVISLLLRTCDFGKSSDNPYAISPCDLEPAPREVKELVRDPLFLERFFKQLLEMPSDHDIALKTLRFLCWENLTLSKIALKHLSFQSMFTPNEVKQGTELLEALATINDSLKNERLKIAFLGSQAEPKYRGYIEILFAQKEIHVWKTYIMLKALLRIIAQNPEANQILVGETSVHDFLYQMEDWLKKQISRSGPYGYVCRSNEMKTSSGLERTDSATNLLSTIKELNGNFAVDDASKASDTKTLDSSGDDETLLLADRNGVYCDTSLKSEEADIERDGKMSPREWFSKTVPINTDWTANNQLFFPGSISVKEKLAATKNLPPPPAYAEGQVLEETPMHPNSPVHLSSAIDGTSHWEKRDKNIEVVDDATVSVFISTGLEMEDSLPSYEEAASQP